MASTVVSIGECMVELARGEGARYGLSYGGDSFNTAVYLARCGVSVAYATALGDDPYSAGIRALADAEGVDGSLIATAAGRMPGLYLIETTPAGERSFFYWRDRSPARELFELPAAAAVGDAMRAARLIYFSGITLSLYSAAGLDRFEAALRAAKAAGVQIAVDGNYRPRGWQGDAERARRTLARFFALADVALPTFDDEAALWSDRTPGDTIARLTSLGIGEIVVKRGPDGALAHAERGTEDVPCPAIVAAVDTTSAGDAFNAGYLAQRLAGAAPREAALSGHRLAAVVIAHRGAIVPAAATAAVLDGKIRT
ncbi:MAG: sugar kinase [Hyphomicrobiaceae bacterium]